MSTSQIVIEILLQKYTIVLAVEPTATIAVIAQTALQEYQLFYCKHGQSLKVMYARDLQGRILSNSLTLAMLYPTQVYNQTTLTNNKIQFEVIVEDLSEQITYTSQGRHSTIYQASPRELAISYRQAQLGLVQQLLEYFATILYQAIPGIPSTISLQLLMEITQSTATKRLSEELVTAKAVDGRQSDHSRADHHQQTDGHEEDDILQQQMILAIQEVSVQCYRLLLHKANRLMILTHSLSMLSLLYHSCGINHNIAAADSSKRRQLTLACLCVEAYQGLSPLQLARFSFAQAVREMIDGLPRLLALAATLPSTPVPDPVHVTIPPVERGQQQDAATALVQQVTSTALSHLLPQPPPPVLAAGETMGTGGGIGDRLLTAFTHLLSLLPEQDPILAQLLAEAARASRATGTGGGQRGDSAEEEVHQEVSGKAMTTKLPRGRWPSRSNVCRLEEVGPRYLAILLPLLQQTPQPQGQLTGDRGSDRRNKGQPNSSNHLLQENPTMVPYALQSLFAAVQEVDYYLLATDIADTATADMIEQLPANVWLLYPAATIAEVSLYSAGQMEDRRQTCWTTFLLPLLTVCLQTCRLALQPPLAPPPLNPDQGQAEEGNKQQHSKLSTAGRLMAHTLQQLSSSSAGDGQQGEQLQGQQLDLDHTLRIVSLCLQIVYHLVYVLQDYAAYKDREKDEEEEQEGSSHRRADRRKKKDNTTRRKTKKQLLTGRPRTSLQALFAAHATCYSTGPGSAGTGSGAAAAVVYYLRDYHRLLFTLSHLAEVKLANSYRLSQHSLLLEEMSEMAAALFLALLGIDHSQGQQQPLLQGGWQGSALALEPRSILRYLTLPSYTLFSSSHRQQQQPPLQVMVTVDDGSSNSSGGGRSSGAGSGPSYRLYLALSYLHHLSTLPTSPTAAAAITGGRSRSQVNKQQPSGGSSWQEAISYHRYAIVQSLYQWLLLSVSQGNTSRTNYHISRSVAALLGQAVSLCAPQVSEYLYRYSHSHSHSSHSRGGGQGGDTAGAAAEQQLGQGTIIERLLQILQLASYRIIQTQLKSQQQDHWFATMQPPVSRLLEDLLRQEQEALRLEERRLLQRYHSEHRASMVQMQQQLLHSGNSSKPLPQLQPQQLDGQADVERQDEEEDEEEEDDDISCTSQDSFTSTPGVVDDSMQQTSRRGGRRSITDGQTQSLPPISCHLQVDLPLLRYLLRLLSGLLSCPTAVAHFTGQDRRQLARYLCEMLLAGDYLQVQHSIREDRRKLRERHQAGYIEEEDDDQQEEKKGSSSSSTFGLLLSDIAQQDQVLSVYYQLLVDLPVTTTNQER